MPAAHVADPPVKSGGAGALAADLDFGLHPFASARFQRKHTGRRAVVDDQLADPANLGQRVAFLVAVATTTPGADLGKERGP